MLKVSKWNFSLTQVLSATSFHTQYSKHSKARRWHQSWANSLHTLDITSRHFKQQISHVQQPSLPDNGRLLLKVARNIQAGQFDSQKTVLDIRRVKSPGTEFQMQWLRTTDLSLLELNLPNSEDYDIKHSTISPYPPQAETAVPTDCESLDVGESERSNMKRCLTTETVLWTLDALLFNCC